MKLMSARHAAGTAAALLVMLTVLAGGAGARPAAIGAQPVVTGLAFPATFTFAPDGRIFYGLRFTGEIRVFDPATSSDTHFFTIPDIAKAGEQGLLGLATSPQYPTKPWVYAYVTRTVSGTENEIVRIKPGPGGGLTMQVLFHTGAATNHNGGHIAFGPSGLLYAVVGENGSPSNAQDLGTTLGKVVRMTANGGVPSGNPISGSYIWAYGIRNSFGFTFDPLSGRLWETENGPECNDEVNRIVKAGNYAWGPSQTCSVPPDPPTNTNQDGPSPILPKRWFTPTIAPTGVAFCSACGLGPESEGKLFFGTYNTHEIRMATLNAKRTAIVSETPVYTHPSAVLSIQAAPDGTLYFSAPGGIYKLVLT